MDVVALAQHGIGNAVATLGTATTATHVQKLLRQVDRIVYCFDGDSPGERRRGERSKTALKRCPNKSRVCFPAGKATTRTASCATRMAPSGAVITQAVPLSEFLLRELSSRCDMTSAEGRANSSPKTAAWALAKRPYCGLSWSRGLAEASGFLAIGRWNDCAICPCRACTSTRPSSAKAPSLLRPTTAASCCKAGELAGAAPNIIPLPDNVAEAARSAIVRTILAREVAIPTAVQRPARAIAR